MDLKLFNCVVCRKSLLVVIPKVIGNPLRAHIYACTRLIQFHHPVKTWLWILYETVRYEMACTLTTQRSCASYIGASTVIIGKSIVFSIHGWHLCRSEFYMILIKIRWDESKWENEKQNAFITKSNIGNDEVRMHEINAIAYN